MAHLIRSGQWTDSSVRSFSALGADHGALVTLLLEDLPSGSGPRLHSHPYPECWVVFSGRGRFVAATQEFDAGPGDILFVEANLPHKFTAIGDDPLRVLCIHQAPEFATIWLEPE